MPHFRISLLLTAIAFLTSCDDSENQSLTITGSSTVAPVVMDAALRYEQENPGTRIDVQTGGSSRGIADARSDLADLGMISRGLKEDETDLQAHRIAVDGVCLIVHADNAIADLSKQQVVDIYTSEISNWKDVGGMDGEIVVCNKAEGRATLEVFLGYTGLDSADIAADIVVGENQQAIKSVAGNPNAIGYVSIGAAASEAEAGTPIKLVACEGIAPTSENVAQGSFPITRPLQVVAHGEVSDLATAFLNYLKSGEINDLIEKHLYVPATD